MSNPKGGNPPRRPDQTPQQYQLGEAGQELQTAVAAGSNASPHRSKLFVDNDLTPPKGGIFIYSPKGTLVGFWIAEPGTDPVAHSSIPGAANTGIVLQDATAQNTYTNLTADGIITEKIRNPGPAPIWVMEDDTASAPFNAMVITNNGGVTMDSWNLVGGGGGLPAFGSGWSNFGSGFARLQYTLKNDNTVMVMGSVSHTNVAVATIFTLPAAYSPVTKQQFPVFDNNLIALVEVHTTGDVVINPAPSANASTTMSFRVALDAT